MRIITGSLGGRTLKTVSGPGYRPAMGKVRSALFSMLESRGISWSECRVLDLFAGSGSLGFEAISRGAPLAVFVEQDAKAAACLRNNAESFGLDNDICRVVEKDVSRYLHKRQEAPFHLIFIDPPYAKNLLAPTIKALTKGGWLDEQGLIAAEIEKHCPLPATQGMLEVETDRNYGQTRIVLWTIPKSI